MKILNLCLILASFIVFECAVHADESSSDSEMTFCHFGPKMKVLTPVYTGKSGDNCTGSARIQGMKWNCGRAEEVTRLEGDFKSELMKEASALCKKHCENRQRGCEGRFSATGCTLNTSIDEAEAMGKKLGCRKDCGGRYFIFCSVYDGGFRMDDADRVKKTPPNCSCHR